MKKIFSILIAIICIFSFNCCFLTNLVNANPATSPQTELVQKIANNTPDKVDVLDEPVFQDDNAQKKQKFTGKLSSIIIKIFGGALLLLVVVICLSFILVANEQRRREKRKKKLGANSNVINAVDNFAKHRIKR